MGRRNVATGGAQSADRRAERNPWERVASKHLPRRGRGDTAPRDGSVKHIFLVELNVVRAKKLQELGLEILLLVMLNLSRDILLHGLFLGLAHGESAVSFLPCECFKRGEGVMHPLRRTRLHGTHE